MHTPPGGGGPRDRLAPPRGPHSWPPTGRALEVRAGLRHRLPALAMLVAGLVEVAVSEGTLLRLSVAATAAVLALALDWRRRRPVAAVALGFG